MRTLEKEQWKDIEGYGGIFIGRYQISSYGRVKSLSHYQTRTSKYGKTYQYKVKEKLLRYGIDHQGYAHVRLHARDEENRLTVKCCYVHRLVAMAFVPNPNPEQFDCVNHLNESKLSNEAWNLEWTNHYLNANYGTCQERRAAKRVKPVGQYDLDGNLIKEWYSVRSILAAGMNTSHIIAICKGKKGAHTSYGCRWAYLPKKNEK